MKTFKEMLIGFGVIALLVIGYMNLPTESRRKKDIDLGNTLIANVEQFQKQHQKLPENNDEAILIQLGFRKNKQGWQPNYQKIAPNHFQIVYADGYEPPFLAWDSQEREWLILDSSKRPPPNK